MDGSEGSLQALRWAAEEARVRKARLHAVLAWDAPVQVVGAVAATPTEAQLAEYGERALERLDSLLAAQAPALAGAEVERNAVHGPPAEVLLEAARGAAELVLGTRGHGGLVGLLLGSVSRQCAHHAPCPVVIVPPVR